MNWIRHYWWLVLGFMATSCGDLLMGPDPENTPINNFEILWNEYDRYYSYFIHKNIDWDSLYTVYRPQVTNNTSVRELFEIISSMVNELKDGHADIYSPSFGYSSYDDWWKQYPIFFNLETIKSEYLGNDFTKAPGNKILYGKLSDEIGYIYVPSFATSSLWDPTKFEVIDDILSELESVNGIIVDVRNNGGGNSASADIIASRFADKKRIEAYVRFRNGPSHDDFSPMQGGYVEPGGKMQFLKPVALLTNRRCFSSTEGFVLSMRVLPHVTVIGDTTGGGAGNPIPRGLPNGWSYRIPRWQAFTLDSINYEGIGLFPDIPIQNSEADSTAGIDTQLEKAIEFLSQQSIG